MKKLTVRQQATLKKHAKHHTKKHMASMRSAMRKGKTFGAAHKEAMKKVGSNIIKILVVHTLARKKQLINYQNGQSKNGELNQASHQEKQEKDTYLKKQ